MGHPFLLFADGAGRQHVLELPAGGSVTIGRRATCDLALPWDDEVSRLHAQLISLGAEWVVCDDGLSHNGTFVNGERVRGRRRLSAGDLIQVGATRISLCAPETNSTAPPTHRPPRAKAVAVTPAQRRVLVALSRPLRASDYAAPASNREIAEELVISVETVKGTLSALFELFGLSEEPQNAKRAALAAQALELLGDQR